MNNARVILPNSEGCRLRPNLVKQSMATIATTVVCLQTALCGTFGMSPPSHVYSGGKPSRLSTVVSMVISSTSESCDNVKKEEKLIKNMQKLQSIKELEKNWNGYDAEPISPQVIQITQRLLPDLYEQPEVFPTGRDTIQLEYEKTNGDYLEFEIAASEIMALRMDPYDNEHEWVINHDGETIEEINKAVKEFYGVFVYKG